MNIPEQLYPFLRNHAFPGNIRELQAVILDAASRQVGSHLGIDTVATTLSLKKNHETGAMENNGKEGEVVTFGTVLPSMKEVRILLIKEALKRAEGNYSSAAKFIGISRQSLTQFLKRHNISL